MSAKELFQRVDKEMHSTSGKNVLVFLVFVGISVFFWLLMALNDEVQHTFEVPVELAEVPDSVTLVSMPPRTISVGVKAKGSGLIRFQWGDVPSIKLKYGEFHRDGGRMVISSGRINELLKSYFGAGSQIMSVRPDSVGALYTTRPGRRLPVRVNAQFRADPLYAINGIVKYSVDSVTVYAAGNQPVALDYVETVPAVFKGLKETTSMDVALKVPAGMRAVPSRVKATVTVEPLISRTRKVPVEVINVPVDKVVVTFPSEVEISYLLPESEYRNESTEALKAIADYNKISPLPTVTKIPVSLPELEAIYYSPTLLVDSVEYLVEDKK